MKTSMHCPVCKNPATSHLATHCGCTGQLIALVPTSVPAKVAAPLPSSNQGPCAVCGGNHPTYDAQGELCAMLPPGGPFSVTNKPSTLER